MLLGLSVVKNEADIIEAMVRHNLTFVDHMHLIDNGSTDGTTEILGALAAETNSVTFESNPVLGHRQKELVNEFVKHRAAQYEPDHVVLLDGDELLMGDAAELRKLCSDVETPVVLNWTTYVATTDDDASECNPIKRIRHRRTKERPAFSKITFPAKLFQDATVSAGMHGLFRDGQRVNGRTTDAVCIAHFPVRSRQQVMSKSLIGHWNLTLRGVRGNQGVQWRDLATSILKNGDLSETEFLTVANKYAARRVQPVVEEPLWPPDAPALRYQALKRGSVLTDILPFVEQVVTELAGATRNSRRAPGLPVATPEDVNSEHLPAGVELVRAKYEEVNVLFCVAQPRDIIQSCHLKG